ncbi:MULTISPECIES: hypothetical protein [unclassified Nostoc]|uniref:hypothetical protein n=1 Tax=unclassified Nostoc TaxID=2593658 RepID=UPI002AD2114F|nr:MULTISPECIES: hypothetical protein [unclassified Nostoc]MDZ8122474.1 hypothetical protein [Nostoc sp. CmiVER01]MDZ8221711.1 hypothetical protein [Nostoc sp. ChiVER01]
MDKQQYYSRKLRHRQLTGHVLLQGKAIASHGIHQYLPIFTHASERPSIRLFSTFRIESLHHRLIAISDIFSFSGKRSHAVGLYHNTVQLSISFFSLRPWRPWRFVKKIEFDKEF